MAFPSIAVPEESNFLDRGISGGTGKLMMLSGAFYIAKDRDSKPQGDDAHFICAEKQIIGVADGVGGWSRQGIDAGIYARELMVNAETAVKTEPQDNVDPSRVLNHAWSNTKAQGSSTASILALQDNSLCAVNIGDSGFMLIRKGEDVYKSPIQQHSFNCPYQLANGIPGCSTPRNAQVFNITAKPGDIVVAGTDGLFDNLFEAQIEEAARTGFDQGLSPEDVAWTIAVDAYYTSVDREVVTPFTQASALAGHSYMGGKQDDITVVVSYIIDS